MKKYLQKGITSIPVAFALSIGIVITGGLTTFWQTARSTDEKINNVKSELVADINIINKDVVKNTTNIENIYNTLNNIDKKLDTLLKYEK